MKIVIDDEKIIDLLETEWGYEGIREDVRRLLIENGTPLPDGAEILTKEAYSDLCTRAADVPNFESEEYVEKRIENYNKLLKSGVLDCVTHESVDESEDKYGTIQNHGRNKSEKDYCRIKGSCTSLK